MKTGKLNTSVINKLFSETDKDKSQSITKTEIEKLVLDIMESGKMKIDNKYAVSEIMKTFDFDSDMRINEHEFINGCKKWIDETSSSEHGDPGSGHIFHELFQVFKEKKEDDPKEIDRIMSKILKHAQTRLLRSESLIAEDGRPNIERIQTLFKQFDTDKNKSISKSELEHLISTVKFGEIQQNVDIVKELLKDFDQDNNGVIDEPEFVAGVTKWLNKAVRIANTTDKTKSIDEFDKIVWKEEVYDKWAFMKSAIKVLFGIVVLTFLGGPLTESILGLSFSMNLPSFCIAFVIVPLATNARTLIAAILPASRKSERSASLTFSEIYGGVIMNNLSGLTTLVGYCVCQRFNVELFGRSANYFCGVCYYRHHGLHTHHLSSMDLLISIFALSLLLRIVLFCAIFLELEVNFFGMLVWVFVLLIIYIVKFQS
ncbi:sodium/calcium exchanger NCL1-like [Primulina tabacum]|uniref:sodium/calcium exchanger NCL1-like n=1 Tax=Primulina tabacum TaxID=48773 RepID=UPI003F598699